MNWKTPITLLVLLAILLGGAWYGWTSVFGGSGSNETSTKPTSGCLQKTVYAKGTVIRSKSITINVFNAGSRSGLADETLRKLKKNGFLPGKTDNGSDGLNVTNVTVVSGAKNDPKAELVAQQFKGKVKVVTDTVAGGPSTIAVYVGDGFKKVDKKAPKKLKVKKPIEICQIG